MEERKKEWKLTKDRYNLINSLQFIVTFLIIVAIFFYNFSFNQIPSGSMYPTLKIGAIALASRTAPEDMQYGDIVIFTPESENPPHNGWTQLYSMHVRHETRLVKRLIGKPGDVIEIRDGSAWRNGERLQEDYLYEQEIEGEMAPYTVPDGTFFCMGDNRNNSVDSRYYGAFPQDCFAWKVLISM